jgi:hypothetical protein
MDGLMVALRGWVAAHKFLFWTVVAVVARWYVEKLHAVYWHREASREQLVLKPRLPKDLYANGYALFAYDIGADAWVGHWRTANAVPGTPAAETYAWREQWTGIPFHEVDFSDMPQITFKVRAVSLEWCRKNLREGGGHDMLAAVRAKVALSVADLEARQEAEALDGQAIEAETAQASQATKH